MLWTPDSNAYEALGYRLTFVRSEVSVADSNSLISDGRVHIVYKYVEGLSRLKPKSKRPWPHARRAEDGGALAPVRSPEGWRARSVWVTKVTQNGPTTVAERVAIGTDWSTQIL